ncbi:hypothetical protein N7448_006880 [Penicillium atrosanguineum]|uniref:Uncharacterized protein n=1 Tax=Penicillium atrosanguineum TaxID=1132637 RepID=A0A9W9L3H4_9EURO|nr:uncharacterized protein N7443_010642 [Penicillium atrosanguineum]KAJ5132722.1 hypothetical protein N7448_006880 [Penicillium atrosanguineum]KAJ5141389.1 hypothetical protein N7526_002384 [Penicillium atrosanguineum]KAJ5290389.1 hypothetical protein N7443_010642 [Penicillium atrosanguineum]KAJ5308211.1 hypothetical protein N7476_008867 [Penicillium atrosanguineum]
MCWMVPAPLCSGISLPDLCNETETIITVTQGFLTALSTKSRVDLGKHCVRAGGMSLSPPSPNAPHFCTIGSFIEHVATLKDEIDERIWDPEVKVHDEGNLATVWAPIRAKINGIVDHVGVELFVLHKLIGEWKVTGLADSCRRPTEEEKNLA